MYDLTADFQPLLLYNFASDGEQSRNFCQLLEELQLPPNLSVWDIVAILLYSISYCVSTCHH